MLPVVLPTLLGQDYPGALTVILVDDCSTDGTAEVAAALGAGPGRPGRALRVLAGAPLPPGWAGKVWAMAQGLAAAGEGDGHGTREVPAGRVRAVHRRRHRLAAGRAAGPGARGRGRRPGPGLADGAAAHGDRVGAGGRVPAFVYFFAQLYPFRRVNSPRSRTAAAAGGCMLVRREALERSGGLAPIRGARIDDVALGQVIKGQRGRCWLGLSTAGGERAALPAARPTCGRWWPGPRTSSSGTPPGCWPGPWPGWPSSTCCRPPGRSPGSRPAPAGRGRAPPAALAAGAGLAGWALMSLTYLPMLRLYRLSPLRAPGLPLIALLYTAMTVDSARRHYAGRGAEWKGRTDRARLRLLRDRHTPEAGSAVGGRAGSRLASVRHRRRLHRHPARRQPARGVPGRARPGRGRDAAHGPGAEPVRDGVLPARRARRGRPGADLHPGERTALRRASGARLGVRPGRGPGHVGADPGDRGRPIPGGTGANRGRIVFGRMEQPIPVPEPYEDTDGAAGRARRAGVRAAGRGVPQRAPARLRRAGQRGRGRRAVAGPARARPSSRSR